MARHFGINALRAHDETQTAGGLHSLASPPEDADTPVPFSGDFYSEPAIMLDPLRAVTEFAPDDWRIPAIIFSSACFLAPIFIGSVMLLFWFALFM